MILIHTPPTCTIAIECLHGFAKPVSNAPTNLVQFDTIALASTGYRLRICFYTSIPLCPSRSLSLPPRLLVTCPTIGGGARNATWGGVFQRLRAAFARREER